MIRPTGWGVCIQPQGMTSERAAAIVAALEPRWYHNWSLEPFDGVDVTPFVPLMWDGLRRMTPVFKRALTELPGHTWMLFNEPERPEQSNMTPAEALDNTRAFLANQWRTGNEFQWAAPGVSLTTTDHDGLAWLTEFAQLCRRRGLSRPSYWHIHLNAASLQELRDAWARWQEWYAIWGACAPVIVSEVCAQNAPLSIQLGVLNWVHNRLLNQQIAAAAWFIGAPSTFVDWPNAALCTLDGQRARLTPLGAVWETTARSAKP